MDLDGWDEGYIKINEQYFTRDITTNKICGISVPGESFTSD